MPNAPKLVCTSPAKDPERSDVRFAVDAMLRAAQEWQQADLPALIGELEAVKATAWARLTALPAPVPHDELLSVEVAADRLGVSKDYLYRHHAQMPFARRQGRKLLFSALGIDRHIRKS